MKRLLLAVLGVCFLGAVENNKKFYSLTAHGENLVATGQVARLYSDLSSNGFKMATA